MKLKRGLILWGPVILWCGVIFGFSSISTPPKVGFVWWDFIIKKTAHIVEYATLFTLIWRAVRKTLGKPVTGKQFLFIFLFSLLYAASDEIHQRFVLGRTSKARDVGFDFAGMLIAWQNIKHRWLPMKQLYV